MRSICVYIDPNLGGEKSNTNSFGSVRLSGFFSEISQTQIRFVVGVRRSAASSVLVTVHDALHDALHDAGFQRNNASNAARMRPLKPRIQ